MNPSLLSILQEQFLGKNVIVPVGERDNHGRPIPHRTVEVAGLCTYIGDNKYLDWELQVTVDGMPIEVKHIDHIRLRPDRKRNRP